MTVTVTVTVTVTGGRLCDHAVVRVDQEGLGKGTQVRSMSDNCMNSDAGEKGFDDWGAMTSQPGRVLLPNNPEPSFGFQMDTGGEDVTVESSHLPIVGDLAVGALKLQGQICRIAKRRTFSVEFCQTADLQGNLGYWLIALITPGLDDEAPPSSPGRVRADPR